EPAERILALERREHARGDRVAADAVEAVAAGDRVALELAVAEAQPRPLALDLVDADVLDLEVERQSGVEPRGDQVLHDLGLAVDDDRAAGELGERDVVALAVELEVDAVVDDPVAAHARAHAELVEQVGGALLEHARAEPV